MDEQTLKLACDALYEHLSLNASLSKGEALQAFLRQMESRDSNMDSQVMEESATQVEVLPTVASNDCTDNEKTILQKDELLRIKEECRTAQQNADKWQLSYETEKQEWENEKRELHDRLLATKQALDEREREFSHALSIKQGDIQRLEQRAKESENELAALHKNQLQEQDAFTDVQAFLIGLSPDLCSIIAPYFDTHSLLTFLVQCGQFNRLNQLWEACGKVVTSGRQVPAMAACLERLLSIYNRAVGGNPATMVAPAPGDTYRSEIHYRVASDGTTIRKLLLPGLRNSGGKVQQNALVELQ